MTTKPFKGKTIYNPSGKAGEYSYWACNFYVGCSVGCEYCYLRKGRGAKILGGDTPKLKSCFKDETHALEVFQKELKQNLSELQKHGLFFSFTTDPMLEETIWLTFKTITICLSENIPVKILTKVAKYNEVISFKMEQAFKGYENCIAFGFTLTGHDELEPNASTNAERIEAMRTLHDAGFKTWASIEPIIDFESSWKMIFQTGGICDLYKVGLMSSKKYSVLDAQKFINNVTAYASARNSKVYFKDSLLKLVDAERILLPYCCVSRDYNLFKSK